jgi:hypothetical protein
VDSRSAQEFGEPRGTPPLDVGRDRSPQLIGRDLWIAGGAPTPLEELQTTDKRLTDLVARWKLKRGRHVDSNISSALRLIERAYEVLEGDLQLGPEAQDGYRKAKKNLERRYANAIDKIDIFMEGLEPFQAARGSARRTTQQALSQARAMAAARQDVIDAVESFQSYFSTLIQQLVRLSRTVG